MIVREAGVNPGSLYHFFESKDQLLVQVLEFALEYLVPAVMAPVEKSTADPIERVFALMAHYRRGMEKYGCRLGCPIGNLALEVSDGYPRARQLVHENFENWARHVERWLVDAGGRLPADTDRPRLARFILTVMEGGLMQARASNSLRPFDECVAVLRDHIELLLARAKPRRGRKEVAMLELLLLPLALTSSGIAGPAPSFASEGVVAAAPGEVWKAWTTSEGEADLRLGGLIHLRLGDMVLENRILAFEAPRMMAFRIERAPERFPFKAAWKNTWTVVTMWETGDGGTHVRIASMGFGSDAESVAMRRYFEQGNAIALRKLQAHFRRAARPVRIV